ncbi:accessory factor UbiK family protein [Methylobacillus arboreus]|uniref:accessory factor UbiK family protein n=1 Tax=Methylobacillus arboreus TaxID=755170 RepID=UPI001E3BFE2B|nr:accessory factor UbiK family protein [Methylobacillus arboreus]MCB5190735.1 accessory factor UbiK family protein [Methylobacillus arboreus]
MNAQMIEELSNKIKEIYSSLPADGIERNLHALLQGAFTKLELVSREEFDIQAEILRKTRVQLTDLEKQLAALEARLEQHF